MNFSEYLLLDMVELPAELLPLVESMLISLSLFVVVVPISAWVGWVLVTRRITTLTRWIAWGALGSALLTPTRLVAEGIPLDWIALYQGRFALWFSLLFFSIALVSLVAARLFAVTAAVGRRQRYQMGLMNPVAPAVVVRPLLLRVVHWAGGVTLLVVLLDFGVAERLGVETLTVALYTLEQPPAILLLQWVLLLLPTLWLLWRSFRALPVVNWQQVREERVSMGTGSFLLLLLSSLLYTPLGIALEPFLHG